jgi:glycolate oxidase FAD binding subunit
MSHNHAQLHSIFRELVGAEHTRPGTSEDSVDGCEPGIVVAPETPEQAAAVLKAAAAAGLSVLPRGGGTKMLWGNRPRGADVILSTARLNRLIAHAHGDMTASAEAGMTIATLQNTLSRHGQMLALDPAWPWHATLGGVLATDSSGPLRVRYGTLRDLVIGITVALPDGTVARAGGNVVKNVAGYDLMKLWTGSLGTLGLATSITVRSHPLPAHSASLVARITTPAGAQAFLLTMLDSPLTPTGLQIVSREEGYDLFARFAGIEASVVAQSHAFTERVRAAGLAIDALDESQAELAWQAHAAIYHAPTSAIIGRFSVLPTALATTLETVQQLARRLRLVARVVVQGTGTGLFRFEGDNEETLAAALGVARARITAGGGSVVVHHAPTLLKQRLDVWGPPGDALPVMRRVKAEFDPSGIMNPGRYIGGI